MQSFFYICEYLGVTPQEFFDEGNTYPETLKEFIAEARQLDPQSCLLYTSCLMEVSSPVMADSSAASTGSTAFSKYLQ